MFMALMAPERVAALGDLVRAEWLGTAGRWAAAGGDIPPAGGPVARRSRRGEPRGPARRTDRCAQDRPGEGLDGNLLPPRVAAVELADVLRPTVATAVYIVFVAHALRAYPEPAAASLSSADAARLGPGGSPLLSLLPGRHRRARRPFTWRGLRFPAERQTILDLFGTNHDAAVWGDPAAFRPQRFLDLTPGPFEFVPQGGGEHLQGHRCPGEWIVVELMERSLQVLTEDIAYDVPDQDLSIDPGGCRRCPGAAS